MSPYGDSLDRLFLTGLRASSMWYGHELSVCWMQTELPPGFAEQMKAAGLAQSYEESGWVRTASSLWTPCVPAQPSAPAALLAPSPTLASRARLEPRVPRAVLCGGGHLCGPQGGHAAARPRQTDGGGDGLGIWRQQLDP